MTSRDRILEIAASKLGNYGKGSPEVFAIWSDCLPAEWTPAQVHQFADKAEWCGAYVLHCLRQAGLTSAHWKVGTGFIYPLGLKRVEWPAPGDIAVKEHPFSHHMIVEWYNNANDWGDCAGNTPFAARHRHGSSVGVDFYSIASLLPEPPEAGFSRDGEYAVPGVQDK